MTIIDKYITREYLKIFFIVLTGLAATVLIVEFVSKIRKFQGIPYSYVARYFMFHSVEVIFTIAPVVVLLSVLLFFGVLKKHGELVSLKSTGISAKRIALPIITASVIITILLVISNLHLVPAMSHSAVYVKEILIERRDSDTLFTQNMFWFRDVRGKIYNVRRIDLKNSRLFGLTLYEFDSEGKLSAILYADEAVYGRGGWEFKSGNIKRFQPDMTVIFEEFKNMPYQLQKGIEEFRGVEKNIEWLDYDQLKQYAQRLTRDGYNADSYKVEQYNRISFPIVALIITFIAIPLGMKGNVRAAISVGTGKGILITFGYWLIHSISLALGHAGIIPPMLAAWAANFIFASAGIYLFMDIEY